MVVVAWDLVIDVGRLAANPPTAQIVGVVALVKDGRESVVVEGPAHGGQRRATHTAPDLDEDVIRSHS
jgi:hypothetical protein